MRRYRQALKDWFRKWIKKRALQQELQFSRVDKAFASWILYVSEQIEEKREALLDESVILAQDALILALSGSSPPRHGHSSLAFQPIGDGQLTGPGDGRRSDCGALSARVASAWVARTSQAGSAVDQAKPQARVQVLEHHHSSNSSVLAQTSEESVSMSVSSSQRGQSGVREEGSKEEGSKVPAHADALAQSSQVSQMQRLLHKIENVKHRKKLSQNQRSCGHMHPPPHMTHASSSAYATHASSSSYDTQKQRSCGHMHPPPHMTHASSSAYDTHASSSSYDTQKQRSCGPAPRNGISPEDGTHASSSSYDTQKMTRMHPPPHNGISPAAPELSLRGDMQNGMSGTGTQRTFRDGWKIWPRIVNHTVAG